MIKYCKKPSGKGFPPQRPLEPLQRHLPPFPSPRPQPTKRSLGIITTKWQNDAHNMLNPKKPNQLLPFHSGLMRIPEAGASAGIRWSAALPGPSSQCPSASTLEGLAKTQCSQQQKPLKDHHKLSKCRNWYWTCGPSEHKSHKTSAHISKNLNNVDLWVRMRCVVICNYVTQSEKWVRHVSMRMEHATKMYVHGPAGQCNQNTAWKGPRAPCSPPTAVACNALRCSEWRNRSFLLKR